MTRTGDVLLGRVQELLPLIMQGHDPVIDIIVTSPPYNIGIPYDGYQDDLPYPEYLDEMTQAFRVLYDATVDGGRMCLNVPCGVGSGERYRPIQNDLDYRVREVGWRPLGVIVWKKAFRGSTVAWGSWASPSSPALVYSFEFVQVYCKLTARMEGRGRKPDITGEEFGAWLDTLWTLSEGGKDKEEHPVTFPAELVYRLLRFFSYPGALVCDPFCGSGTTGMVALSMDRKFLGFEVSPRYAEMSRRALGQAYKLPPVMAKLDQWAGGSV